MDTPRVYSPLQRALHWIMALLVIGMIVAGLYMTRRAAWSNFDAVTGMFYNWHKLIGFALLWLVLLRLAVRLTRGAPPPEPTLSPLLRLASATTHWAMYVLLLVVPILGWVGVSAFGARTAAVGVTLPAIVAQDQEFAKVILAYHSWAAILLGLLILMHVGAALMHRFVFKDGVFARMWPTRRHS